MFLESNAGHRAPFIIKKQSIGHRFVPDADNASDKEVLEKTQKVVKDKVRDKFGQRLANNIADAFQLKHTKEYKESNPKTDATSATPSSSSSMALPERRSKRNDHYQ